jgi:hypothetical protein
LRNREFFCKFREARSSNRQYSRNFVCFFSPKGGQLPIGRLSYSRP